MTDYELLAAVFEHLTSVSYYIGCDMDGRIVAHLMGAEQTAERIVDNAMRAIAQRIIGDVRALLEGTV